MFTQPSSDFLHKLTNLNSSQILSGLAASGFEFLARACSEPGFLEDVSGLSRLKSDMLDHMDEILEFSDDDSVVSVKSGTADTTS